MNTDQALNLVAEIEQLIEGGGFADPPTLRRIEAIVFSLRASCDATGLTNFKLTEILSLVQILFSARKHQKYGGADRVRHLIRNQCASARMRINRFADHVKKLPE